MPRIPVKEPGRDPLLLATDRYVKRAYGKPLTPVEVMGHNRKLLVGYSGLELALESSKRLPATVKHLVQVKAAMLAGCEYCMDIGTAISRKHGATEEQLRDLVRYEESDAFTDVEKLAIELAVHMTRTPVEVPEDLIARLREHFDEGQMVELCSAIALENYRARFNHALGIESQEFTAGAFCVRAEQSQPAAAAGV